MAINRRTFLKTAAVAGAAASFAPTSLVLGCGCRARIV